MWRYGDQVVLRYRKAGRISVAMGVTVVEDSDDFVALYLAAETPMKRKVALDGTAIPRDLPYEERHAIPWTIGESVWRENGALQLARPGAAHAILLFWRGADWAFRGWYVNLQAPLVRTAIGFDSEDYVLDVDVAPDLAWRWKDEDELAAAQRVGRFTGAEAAAIRAEGERAIAAIAARAWPYDAGWEHWRPDPSWDIPVLPPEWHEA